MRPSADYHAFLLRLWRDHTEAPWRFAIQRHHEREPMGFASFNELVAFLHYLMQLDGSDGEKPGATNSLEDAPP